MLIYRIYVGNSLRNYNYVIACDKTKDAAIIDPLDVNACIDIANKNNLNITKILNTHEHWDHIEGNDEVVKLTGAKIYAHYNCKDKIDNIYKTLKEGDIINIGESIQITCLDTPGHTFGHICFLANYKNKMALFSGDTLFNAGAGNCYSGDMELLYKSFTDKLAHLCDDVLIYPGHDYLENNLNFTLSIEPNNTEAKKLLEKIKQEKPNNRVITSLFIEKQINSFFRLNSEEIKRNLVEKFKTKFENLSKEQVFFKLRELRNKW
tara:strand:- start:20968 stop:21759 length:792 start_codon:yes stop_codon:yes gene_type:complete